MKSYISRNIYFLFANINNVYLLFQCPNVKTKWNMMMQELLRNVDRKRLKTIKINQIPIYTKKLQVYVPGMSRTLKESEELVYDSKAYLMLHTFETGLFLEFGFLNLLDFF